MTQRTWLIAPFGNEEPSTFEQIWKIDRSTNSITLGWPQLRDLSSLTEDEIRSRISSTWPDRKQNWVSRLTNVFLAFYREINIGDRVIARRGTRRIAGVGSVTAPAYFHPSYFANLGIPNFDHENILPVRWAPKFQPIEFDSVQFGMWALNEVSNDQGDQWLGIHRQTNSRRNLPVFLSYRRDEGTAVARLIYERIANALGHDSAFVDFTMPAAVNFRDHLIEQIEQSSVVLVLIGARWLGQQGDIRRIDAPDDYVRMEIEHAIKCEVPIIPIMIGDAPMPTPRELPESIQSFAFRQGMEVDPAAKFEADMESLLEAIRSIRTPK